MNKSKSANACWLDKYFRFSVLAFLTITKNDFYECKVFLTCVLLTPLDDCLRKTCVPIDTLMHQSTLHFYTTVLNYIRDEINFDKKCLCCTLSHPSHVYGRFTTDHHKHWPRFVERIEFIIYPINLRQS